MADHKRWGIFWCPIFCAIWTAFACAALTALPAAALDFTAPVERLASGFQNSEGPVWVAARRDLGYAPS